MRNEYFGDDDSNVNGLQAMHALENEGLDPMGLSADDEEAEEDEEEAEEDEEEEEEEEDEDEDDE